MFTRLYWIEEFENGAAMGIMPRPRGNDWLPNEIKRLDEAGVSTIVSLLEKDEIHELGLREESSVCREYRIAYIHLPIRDRQLPADEEALNNVIIELRRKIEAGEKIIIHCRMGIGRASIIAGAVLLRKGLKAEHILEKITKARGIPVPDTEEQLRWLKRREN